MKTALYPDDVLVAILVHWKKYWKRTTFSADRVLLHSIFYEIKKHNPVLMKPFHFRARDVWAESEALDQALSNLCASGLLGRYLDPKVKRACGDTYEIKDGLQRYYDLLMKEHGKKFCCGYCLWEAAREFEKMISGADRPLSKSSVNGLGG